MATTKKTPTQKKTPQAQPTVPQPVENITMKTDLLNFEDGNFIMVVDVSDGDILTVDWLPEMTERQAQYQFELLYDDLVFALLDDNLSGCVILLMRASIGKNRNVSLTNVKLLKREGEDHNPKILTAIRKAVADNHTLLFKRGTGFIDVTVPKTVTAKKTAPMSTKASTVKAVGTEKVAVVKRSTPVKKAAASKAPAVKKTAPAKKAPAKAAVSKTAPVKKAPAKTAAVKKAAVKRTAPVKKTAAA